MKKFFSILIFSLTILVGNFAQSHDDKDGGRAQDPGIMAQHQTDRMKKGLMLTDSQAVQVQHVNIKFMLMTLDAIKEVKESGDMSQVQNKIEGLELARTENLRPILTEEQMKKWPKLRRKMQDESMPRSNSGGMRRGNGMGSRMGGGMGGQSPY